MIAFIADIHGNLPALEAVFEDLKKYPVSRIYSLGDVAGYYPFINETIELLKENNVEHILGNHDNYLANDIDCSRSSKVNHTINYQRNNISKDNLLWLKDSPSYLDEDAFFAVHGGINDYLEEYSSGIYFPESVKQNLFLCAHTHIQKYAVLEGKCFCNPGSVGQPRDGDPRAAYALFDEDKGISLCRVKYDIGYIAKAMSERGFSPDYYTNLYVGEPIGGRRN